MAELTNSGQEVVIDIRGLHGNIRRVVVEVDGETPESAAARIRSAIGQ